MTDDTVTARLAEWEALVEGATPGPWEAVGDGDPYLRRGDVATRGEPGNRFIVCEHAGPDAEFIAAAPTIARALLGFVREVRALHVSSSESRGVGRVDPETGEWGAYCDHDSEWWPCPTVQALTKRIGGEG